MAPSAGEDENSSAPTVNEGENPAGAANAGAAVVGGAEGTAMEVEPAVEVPEKEEDEPDEAPGVDHDGQAGAEEGKPDDGAEEEGPDDGAEEEEPDEEAVEEESDEEAEDAEEADESEGDAGDEYIEELVEEEYIEELVEDTTENEAFAQDAMKGIVEGSAVHDTIELPKEEPGKFRADGKHGDNNKDGVADQSTDNGEAKERGNCGLQTDLSVDREIMVDELPKDCVEEDIKGFFSKCGDIESIRIIKNSSTEKSKDTAFVCYGNIEAARKALAEYKEGIEVKGKKVRVSACQDNNTLYLGSIHKNWTKDQVLTTLKGMGIGQLEMNLRTFKNGRGRGFAFLQFASHYDARAALHKLMSPDATFGLSKGVKVSFARPPKEPSEKFHMEAKTVYIEPVPPSWDEGKVKECCEGYGVIHSVNLFQILKGMDQKLFCFVEFSSSTTALTCVEGINNANIVDGGFKLSASLVQHKGGFTIDTGSASEDVDMPKETKDRKEVTAKNSLHKLSGVRKSKLTSQTKGITVKKAPNELEKGKESRLTSQGAVRGAAEVPQTSNPSNMKGTVVKNKNTKTNKSPSKKAWSNRNVDEGKPIHQGPAEVLLTSNPSKGKRKAANNIDTYRSGRPSKKAQNNRNFVTRSSDGGYARGTGQPVGRSSNSQAYSSVRATSISRAHASDLEPHAGFVPPSNRLRSKHSGTHNIHQADDVLRYSIEAPHAAYSSYTRRVDYEPGSAYAYPAPQAPRGSDYHGSGLYIPRRDY